MHFSGMIGSELDLWKLHMRLRSGLLAESAWAVEVMNIFSSDEVHSHHLKLSNAPPGFLDTILDLFGVTMSRLLKCSAKNGLTLGGDVNCNGHGMNDSKKDREEPQLDPRFFPDSDHYRTNFLARGEISQPLPENLKCKVRAKIVDFASCIRTKLIRFSVSSFQLRTQKIVRITISEANENEAIVSLVFVNRNREKECRFVSLSEKYKENIMVCRNKMRKPGLSVRNFSKKKP